MEHPEFVQVIVSWYQKNKRNLPWRAVKSAYYIWLSEVLLQQTRVNQGLPYYLKFINEFPNITSMANASEDKILRLWQGLGYYSRARNMHATAKFIVNELNGVFPDSYKEIVKLKGVGEYTAAAVASFAFGEKVAVLDGNVFRVLSRVFGIEENIAGSKGRKQFQTLASSLLPDQHSDTYNQAIMEFGALQCTPAKPDCINCPCAHFCYARIHKKQDSLPVKIKNTTKRLRLFNYSVITFGNKILMSKREGKDIWTGLYQFPLKEAPVPTEGSSVGQYRHILSHQIIEACFERQEADSEAQLQDIASQTGSTIYTIEEVENLPKPVLINNYLKEYFF